MLISMRTVWKKLVVSGIAARSKGDRTRVNRTRPAVEYLEDRSCPAGSVLGTKYDDLNGNGARDDGEPGVAGVTVYADLNHNGTHDLGGSSVEPDDYAEGQDLTSVVPGVTLGVANFGTTAASTFFRVYANTDPDASTGGKVFTESGPPSPGFTTHGIPTWTTGFKFRAEFAQPVGYAAIDFIGSTISPGFGRLEAYNAQGQLVASYNTAGLLTRQVETMAVDRPQQDIKFILAYTPTGSPPGRLDNLNFGFPEPSAVTDAQGNYAITGLAAGDYVIREVVPAGQHQTDPGPQPPVDGQPGVFFGAAYIPGTDQTQLAEIDAATGRVTRIGGPMAQRMHGLVMTNDGSLYGINYFDDSFYGVNRATGQTTRIGAAGLPLVGGLTYDPATDTIYGLATTDPTQGTISLVVFNRATGSAVAVGPGLAGLTGTSGLAFDATHDRVLALDNDTQRLYAFDVMTGAGALLSTLPAGDTGWGLAFDGQYAVVGRNGGSDNILAYYDVTTGALVKTLTMSEPASVESLEFVAAEPFTRRVTVGPDETVSGIDFGNQTVLGSIRGTKFEDYNADGVRDPNEPGLGGVPVYLDLNHNGIRDIDNTIEPDDYAERQDLTSAVPGVTLNVTTSGTGPNASFQVLATTDPNSSTGGKVFSESGIPFWTTGFKFRAEFAQPVGHASLDFIGASSITPMVGRLEAYNAQGVLVASYTTAGLLTRQVETMTVERVQRDIKFILAYTSAGAFGRLDNLRYEAPEPVAVTDSDGRYAFVGLQPGDYVVREVVPAGYRQTLPGPGTTGAGPGVFFGAAYIPGTDQTQLAEIDAATGRVTRIGAPMAQRMHGLVMTNDGSLYGVNGFNPGDDGFYRVDRATGQVTLVGPTGFDLVWGLTYDAATDTIYGLGQTAPGVNSLLVIDRATGAATVIGSGVTGLTGTSGLAFDGVHNRVLAFDNDDQQLYAFDPATGAGALLSTLPAGTAGWGLAFDGQYAVVGLNGANSTSFGYYDPDTGLRAGTLNLTGPAVVESLEFVAHEPFTRRVAVAPGEAVAGVDFGDKGPNHAPVADAGGPYTVTEGEPLTLDASGSTDVEGGALSYSWDLDGDGQFDDATGVSPTLTWAQLVSFGIADDGTYTARVRVTDADPDAPLASTAGATITVLNAAPVLETLVGPVAGTPTAATPGGADVVFTGVRGQSLAFSAAFTDAGPLDTHEVQWDFGDGTVTGWLPAEAVSGLTHTYAAEGAYNITVAVRDDDGGAASFSRQIEIKAVELQADPNDPSKTALVVGGTTGADDIEVAPGDAAGSVAVSVNGVSLGNFSPSGSVFVFAQAGDDDVSVDGAVGLPAWLFGGDGNDRLKGGAGNDVVVGGAGDDLLIGNSGRDLLIGGAGADRIIGNADDDILIAGSTAYDSDLTALAALMTEWTRADLGAADRVAHLDGTSAGGLNGNYVLTGGSGATVFEDGAADVLTGAAGDDWFISDGGEKDEITGWTAYEQSYAEDIAFLAAPVG